MIQMPSIHDSLLTGYTVDGTNKTIVLHTHPEQGGPTVPIDVIFSGVVAYHFEGDCLGNVEFGIEEVPSADIVGDGIAFAERGRLYGWPKGWDMNRETPEEFLSRVGCRCFALHCSYGMCGWVAANGMEQLVRGMNAEP